MLLLTFNEWLGPGRRMSQEESNRCHVRERQIAFATKLSLEQALRKINDYQESYNKFYPLGLVFRLLHIAIISDISEDILDNVGVMFVENLNEDFE